MGLWHRKLISWQDFSWLWAVARQWNSPLWACYKNCQKNLPVQAGNFDHPLKWFKKSNFFVKVLWERRQFLKVHNISPQPISHCYETSLESLMAEVYELLTRLITGYAQFQSVWQSFKPCSTVVEQMLPETHTDIASKTTFHLWFHEQRKVTASPQARKLKPFSFNSHLVSAEFIFCLIRK